jgi:hypothetical protein
MHKQFYINIIICTEERKEGRMDALQTNFYFIYKRWTTDKFLFYLYENYLF